MRLKLIVAMSLAAAPLWLTSPAMAQPVVPIEQVRDRLPEDEVIYFVLPDRFANGDVKNDTGGIKGDRMKPSEGMRWLDDYERGLRDYTYLTF